MTEPSSPPASTGEDIADLLAFIDAAPSPYHAVVEARRRLETAGFSLLDQRDRWPTEPGRHLVVRGGSLVAWSTEATADPAAGFRIVGAHTDSPNLRLKPRPDSGAHGWRQLGVEVYGGALWNSWLDRDLGLSGRVAIRTIDGEQMRLLAVDRPLARVPQLAIHLDRTVNSEGLKLNAQQHLAPVWGVGAAEPDGLRHFVADELEVAPDAVVGWDLMLHDLTAASLLGVDRELVSASRIDNLLSCWAATRAIVPVAGDAGPNSTPGSGATGRPVPVICQFDHEEVGSQSATGADSTILATVLERVSLLGGLDREDHLRALSTSMCLSADGAHAIHPNYPDRHEPAHQIRIDGGPVVKSNANARYATDAVGAAEIRRCAEVAGTPLQDFVVRSDMGCGSTIGPVTSARLGITTVDVGVAQLAMHSVRELCGRRDAERFVPLLAAFLQG